MAQGLDEFELISRYFAPLARDTPGALGLTDDAAVVRPDDGYELVISADALVSGVHFSGPGFATPTDPADIAQRALRSNLSDLAAMGATPLGYTLTLQMPDDTDEAWLAAFADGLMRDLQEFGIGLLGGDTTRTPGPLTLSINVFGQVSENKAIIRSGAQLSDDVYVSGTIGDSVLGLALENGDFPGSMMRIGVNCWRATVALNRGWGWPKARFPCPRRSGCFGRFGGRSGPYLPGVPDCGRHQAFCSTCLFSRPSGGTGQSTIEA